MCCVMPPAASGFPDIIAVELRYLESLAKPLDAASKAEWCEAYHVTGRVTLECQEERVQVVLGVQSGLLPIR